MKYNKSQFLREFGQFNDILTTKMYGGDIRVTPLNPNRVKYGNFETLTEYGIGKNKNLALINLKNRLMRTLKLK